MSIQEPGCSLPRYSTGGVGGAGVGVVVAGQAFSTTGGHMSGCTAAISFGGSGVAHPASTRSAAQQAGAIADNGRMAWVFLEILVALAVAVAIVWWTIPKKPKRDDADADR
jgi:hypothetical protein